MPPGLQWVFVNSWQSIPPEAGAASATTGFLLDHGIGQRVCRTRRGKRDNGMIQSVHIIGSKDSGGAERFYARLVNSLRGQEPVLAVNPPGSAVSRLLDPEVEQRHIPLLNNQDLLSRLLIRRWSSRSRPCVVQSYMGRATRLTRIPPGRGMVHVARLGGYYHLKAYRHAHHLVGNTRGICDYLIREGVPSSRVHYIGNFVEPIPAPPAAELATLRRSAKIPDDAFVICCAARFHENKGLPDLIAAFSLFREKHPGARLVLVGDGGLRESLQGQIRSSGLSEFVVLPGWCDPRPWYHLADVLTCPSRHEPLGNTILEAWACRRPLVATATQGALELVSDGENGLITPLRDPAALADALERLHGGPSLRQSLAESGEQTVRRQFSRERITADYLGLYSELLSQA